MDSKHLMDVKMENPDSIDWFYYGEPLFSETDRFDPSIGLLEASTMNQFNTLCTTASKFDGLDDFDFDLSFWDDDGLPSFHSESTFTTKDIIRTVEGSAKAEEVEEEQREEDGKCDGGSRLRSGSLEFEEISKYFYVPITQAAKDMKVGLTVLKKRCRELGISRWPHRKMKSLKSLIHNVQELVRNGGNSGDFKLKGKIERLEEHQRLMEKMPEMQLTEETKKLRQACFKANYKKRRAMGSS